MLEDYLNFMPTGTRKKRVDNIRDTKYHIHQQMNQKRSQSDELELCIIVIYVSPTPTIFNKESAHQRSALLSCFYAKLLLFNSI